MAHGWAGILFAMIRWSEADPATPVPGEMFDWLDALGHYGERVGRGVCWPWVQEQGHRARVMGYASGWCNGSAGFIPLWGAAARAFGRAEDLRRAEGAAWDAWQSQNAAWSLCCGTTGRAFALCEAARLTGDRRWVSRARILADQAVRQHDTDHSPSEHRHSLFRGEAGLTLLLAELEQPGAASFPLFGVVS
jgi:serine/threonine-protein kinase